jgi:hypothetical protein
MKANPKVISKVRLKILNVLSNLGKIIRVVDILHVKEPQVPKGNRWAKLRTFPVQEVDHVTATGVSSAVLW